MRNELTTEFLGDYKEMILSFNDLMDTKLNNLKLVISNPWSLWSLKLADVNNCAIKIVSAQPYGGVIKNNIELASGCRANTANLISNYCFKATWNQIGPILGYNLKKDKLVD